MKLLCSLATIALFSAQANAGVILPNLSRSKSDANLSPIAVGFSERNSATATYARTTAESKANGAVNGDTTENGGGASVFYSNPTFRFELTGAITATSDSIAKSNVHNYDFGGSFAMPFMQSFSAGVAVNLDQQTDKKGSTKTTDTNLAITPAIGMKFLPNMAAGLGFTHTFNNSKSVVINGAQTEYPELGANRVFAGVAYGVDQKIGENGFGVEAVVSHSFKKEVTEGTYSRSQGSVTSLLVDGHFIADKLDLAFSATGATGKDYDDVNKVTMFVLVLAPEYTVYENYYVTPKVGYASLKNSDDFGNDTTLKATSWQYGLDLGMRTAKYDIALGYSHGSADLDLLNAELDSNTINARFSFYY